MPGSAPVALRAEGVGLRRGGRWILSGIDWSVSPDQRWVVLGPNGSGKTTLARICTLWEHPSAGSLEVLGERLGSTDVRSLRRRIALVSAAMSKMIRPGLSAHDVVLCARFAALEPWWHTYRDEDHVRADELLAAQGVGSLSQRSFGSLSSGETQRVLLARSLMAEPGLVVLDEPAAGLDLGGREELVDRLDAIAARRSTPPLVLVTHHVEEIPPSFTHVVFLRGGTVMAMGPIATTLTSDALSSCFGVGVELTTHHGPRGPRWSARRV